MRLLDLIAQAREPFVVEHGEPPQICRLQGAADLAPEVLACPQRYVLSDELAFLCAELAYSSGDRLAGCLDLLCVPAQRLWIEWSDGAALAGAAGFFGERAAADTEPGRRVGILVQGQADGTQALMRAFWSDQDQPVACPMEALLDLRQARCFAADPRSRYRQWIAVTDPIPAVAQLLDCARFRLESSWADFYARTTPSPSPDMAILRTSLTGIARDIPVLIAFLLLLSSREGVAVRPVNWDALNRKRVRHGRTPLLEHLEASLALQPEVRADAARDSGYTGRFAPRRHHVRGHLVRRRNRIFWRRPHLRGSAFRGQVLTRTVRLSFEREAARPG